MAIMETKEEEILGIGLTKETGIMEMDKTSIEVDLKAEKIDHDIGMETEKDLEVKIMIQKDQIVETDIDRDLEAMNKEDHIME